MVFLGSWIFSSSIDDELWWGIHSSEIWAGQMEGLLFLPEQLSPEELCEVKTNFPAGVELEELRWSGDVLLPGLRVPCVPREHSQLWASAHFAALLRDVLGSLELWDITKDGAQGWIIADKWCDGPKEKCRQRSQEIFLCSCIFS